MNTFLPHPSYSISAKILDWRRLNKQVTEGLQLCNLMCRLMGRPLPPRYQMTTSGSRTGWKSHPVVKLWSSPSGDYYLRELVEYVHDMATEWLNRPQCRKAHTWFDVFDHYLAQDDREPNTLYWGSDFHRVMVANLMRKQLEDVAGNKVPAGTRNDHYTQMCKRYKLPIVQPIDGYIWTHPTIVTK